MFGSFYNDKFMYIEYLEMIYVYLLLLYVEGVEVCGFIMDFIR